MANEDIDKPFFRSPPLRGLARMSMREISFIAESIGAGMRVIEVGSASGVTCRLLADARPQATFICIDYYGDAYEPHVVAEDGPARVDNWRFNRRDNMHLWLGTFQSFEDLNPQKHRFGAAIVDVDCPYSNVFAALQFAQRMTRRGAPIFVHDFGCPSWPDVEPATRDFCGETDYHITGACDRLRKLQTRHPARPQRERIGHNVWRVR